MCYRWLLEDKVSKLVARVMDGCYHTTRPDGLNKSIWQKTLAVRYDVAMQQRHGKLSSSNVRLCLRFQRSSAMSN